MALAQDDQLARRYYSLSSEIVKRRKQYYEVLEAAQIGIAGASRRTAIREIQNLLSSGMLRQNKGKGRSVSYDIDWVNFSGDYFSVSPNFQG